LLAEVAVVHMVVVVELVDYYTMLDIRYLQVQAIL
jgi:hypothetical protein